MHVSCESCGATYDFEASLIPPTGYDAECSACHTTFFLSSGDTHRSFDCAGCGAHYRFPIEELSADITPSCGGCALALMPREASSDATQSQSQSFEPVAVTAVPVASMSLPDVQPQTNDTATPKLARSAQTNQTDIPPVSVNDAILSLSIGEPVETRIPDPPEPYANNVQGQRRWIVAGFVTLALLGVFTAVTYTTAPLLFDATIGKVVGIKLTIIPAAIERFEAGMQMIWRDDTQSLAQAHASFSEALKIDPAYPDAMAMAALATAFQGSDAQAQGRYLLSKGEAAQAKVDALVRLSTEQVNRPRESLEELRRVATNHATEAAAYLERGSAQLAQARAQLQLAVSRFPENPLVLEAAGIVDSVDPDHLHRAELLLMRSLRARGATTWLDADALPPSPWNGLLAGLTQAGGAQEPTAKARDAFSRALKVEPRFHRARLQLAYSWADAGRWDAVRRIAGEILAQNPTHERARLLVKYADDAEAGRLLAHGRTPVGRRRWL